MTTNEAKPQGTSKSQIPLLLGTVLIVYVGQMTLSPIIAPLSRRLGMPEWQLGVTISAAAVMVADCVPLLLLTGNRPLAAAVHVGRGGLLAGIAVKAVDELRRRGGEDVSAVLGPSICGRCYEVPPSMRDEADALAPGAAATTSWGTPSVDIPRALVRQLASRGVEEVRLLGVCTFEDPAYFSHRRACAAGGKAGRFAGIAEATRDTPA